jgi:hypothetical protein
VYLLRAIGKVYWGDLLRREDKSCAAICQGLMEHLLRAMGGQEMSCYLPRADGILAESNTCKLMFVYLLGEQELTVVNAWV